MTRLLDADDLCPARDGYSMPAEWAPHARTWMCWPCRIEAWGGPDGLLRAKQAVARVARGDQGPAWTLAGAFLATRIVRLRVAPQDRKTSGVRLRPCRSPWPGVACHHSRDFLLFPFSFCTVPESSVSPLPGNGRAPRARGHRPARHEGYGTPDARQPIRPDRARAGSRGEPDTAPRRSPSCRGLL